ncbi:unnamed protein product, partial [Notodromas monacha]
MDQWLLTLLPRFQEACEEDLEEEDEIVNPWARGILQWPSSIGGATYQILDKPVLRSAPSLATDSDRCRHTWLRSNQGERFQRYGLSPNELEVYLHPVEEDERIFGFDPNYRNRDIRLWLDSEDTMGKWKAADILYSFPEQYKILFEATPKTDERRFYRGYFALDNIEFLAASDCQGHCNFDGSFCSWSNSRDDNFDWSLGRGSDNDQTGPKRDRTSTAFGGKNGGYAFIDTSYPRRPGDLAVLESAGFSKTSENEPHCMTFYTHMLGSGIGALNVFIRPSGQEKRLIWKAEGPEGNTWYKAQAPIASSVDFQILMEASVGKNNLGFIAVDDISFTKNSCPILPSKAQVNAGDCSFDRDLCNYRRTEDGDRLGNWQLAIAGERLLRNMADHTYNNPAGGYAYFDIYDTNQRKIRLISPVIEPPRDEDDRACLAFWFHPLGSGDSTTLQLMQRIGDSNEVVENDEKMTP